MTVRCTESTSASIEIAGRRIGADHPVFIVAEAGVNHDGSLKKAIALVDAAIDSGADAVKFQLFRVNDLVAASAPTASYQQRSCGSTSQREMLRILELSPDDFDQLARYCQRQKIIFLCTPFTAHDVTHVVNLGAPAIKIASTDLTNLEIIESAVKTGVPLIVSTGASTLTEIEQTVEYITRLGGASRLTLLHCVSCYPTELANLNLLAICALKFRYGVPVGLSDHTLSTRTGGWAAAVGACLLEKHLTLDERAAGPDHAMSLNPVQFRQYVDIVREAETALGTGEIGMSDVEREVRSVAAKSVVTATALHRGTRIETDMLSIKRPGTGIPPADLSKLIGKCVNRDLPADTVLTWDDVE